MRVFFNCQDVKKKNINFRNVPVQSLSCPFIVYCQIASSGTRGQDIFPKEGKFILLNSIWF